MTNSNSILPAELQHLALKQPEQKTADGDLGQDDFLELMLTQIRHQDPLNPADSNEFTSQLAQLSTATGIEDLNKSFATLSSSFQSSQALQASTMVGATVLVPSEIAELSVGNPVDGKVFSESSTANLVLNISDATGQSVRKISLGTHEAGLVEFSWDGLDNNGNALPAGNYTIKAATTVDDETVAQTVLVNAKVDSVSLISGGQPLLNLSSLGTYSMNDVLEIK